MRSSFMRWISIADCILYDGSHRYRRPCALLTPRILTGGGISPPLPGAGELSNHKNFKKGKKGVAIYVFI